MAKKKTNKTKTAQVRAKSIPAQAMDDMVETLKSSADTVKDVVKEATKW